MKQKGETVQLVPEEIDLHPESKWNNVYVNPKQVVDVEYVGDNHILMTVMRPVADNKTITEQHELMGFAATKLFRMTGVHKAKVHKEWMDNLAGGVQSTHPQILLDAINNKAETDIMILRQLKEDEGIKSIVGRTYIPIDMEELEAHAFKTITDNGISVVTVERYKSNYARGHDTTNIVLSEIKRSAPKVGDLMSIGIQIQNNELGTRGISLCLYSERLACSNGMCHYNTEQLITETHLGSRNDILLKFDEVCSKIIDNAWDVLEWIDRAGSIDMTWEQMNNYLDNLVVEEVISGKIADEIKKAVNEEKYGSAETNLWSFVNAITGVATHDASHGVKLELDKIASELIELESLVPISKRLNKVSCDKTKAVIAPIRE